MSENVDIIEASNPVALSGTADPAEEAPAPKKVCCVPSFRCDDE
jgi:hypothetical protein